MSPRAEMRAGFTEVRLRAWVWATLAAFCVALPAMALAGGCVALFDVWWLTALAERIPPDKLSRVASYDWMFSLALLPVGYLLAGRWRRRSARPRCCSAAR